MSKYWTYKKIKKVHNDLQFLTETNKDLNFYTFSDYLKIFKLIFNYKKNFPNIPVEIFIIIIEMKFNLELQQNHIFNNFNLYLSMIQLIFKRQNFSKIGHFSFYNQYYFNDLNNQYNYDSFYDIANVTIGMGHVIFLSLDKKYKKYFFRFDGGSNGFEVEHNYSQYKKLNIEKHLNKLMKFKDILKFLKSKRNICLDSSYFGLVYNKNNSIIF